MKTYRFIIKGYVQGVGYRFYVQRVSRDMGVLGYVKNLSDGSVEVVANLQDSQFKDYLLMLRRGSAFSKVREITYAELPFQEFDSFEIRH